MFEKLRRKIIYTLSPISPKLCSELMYLHRFHKPLNLDKPKTLNEKVMWLKLNEYASNPLVSMCADKYKVREYVQSAGYGDILNELLYVWDNPDEIDWDILPNSFVIKCNHGCGYNYICEDKAKADKEGCIKLLHGWMEDNYWRRYAEVQYKNIEKKVICETYLGDDKHFPVDYKIYCFNGRPEYILACEERESGNPKFYFFDTNWTFCPITHDGLSEPEDFTLPKPINLCKMIEVAEKLSSPFPFVRVDFYEVGGKLIFGELTFTPSAGLDTNRMKETDELFGEMLKT